MSELSAILTPFGDNTTQTFTKGRCSFILISFEQAEEPGNP
jgi:hypothetical protein